MATADPALAATVVAIAAEGREFNGLLRHASQSRPATLPLDFARHAQIAGEPWLLAANGPGSRLAGEATESAVGAARPRAVVSTGFCGALNPGLRVADVFVATRLLGGGPFAQPGLPRQAFQGPLLSQDRVAATVPQKQALWSSGAHVVEMEAAGVAHVAAQHRLPCYCVRVVSDTAATSMPMDFNDFRDPTGRFDRTRIARTAVWRPWLWVTLFQFDQHCRRASNALGDFLADCHF